MDGPTSQLRLIRLSNNQEALLADSYNSEERNHGSLRHSYWLPVHTLPCNNRPPKTWLTLGGA